MNYNLLYKQQSFSRSPNLSIIIPSYRPSEVFLSDCLYSILNQYFETTLYIEIVIVLNGDKYPYWDWVKLLISDIFCKSENFNVCVNFVEKNGVSNARNIGVENSLGEYIVFIDDDDWISQNYITELYTSVKAGNFPLSTMVDVIEGVEHESYYGKKFNELKKVEKLNLNSIRSWFSLPVLKIFRKKDIGNHKFNLNLSNGEDGLFVFDVLNSKLNFVLTSNKAIYYRRVRPNSLVAKLKGKNIFKRGMHASYLSFLYIIHYFKYGCKYSPYFLMTRILAPFKHIIKK